MVKTECGGGTKNVLPMRFFFNNGALVGIRPLAVLVVLVLWTRPSAGLIRFLAPSSRLLLASLINRHQQRFVPRPLESTPGFSTADLDDEANPRPTPWTSPLPVSKKKISWLSKAQALVSTDKETYRKYRRTVFNKNDWKVHRSSNRYFRELANMPNSLILRGLGMQTLIVTIFSFLVVVWNTVLERFCPFPMPLLSFPPLPFNLLSSALGLLLVFRTNVAYSRWRDGRVSWATISARSFDLMRQAVMWINDDAYKARLVRYTAGFAKTVKWHLGHQGNDRRLRVDLEGVLTKGEIDDLIKSRARVHWMMLKIAEVLATAKILLVHITHLPYLPLLSPFPPPPPPTHTHTGAAGEQISTQFAEPHR